MEIKVTFRFDASDSLLSCVDNFRKAMEAMAASGGLSVLPENKEAGIVKAIATKEGVRYGHRKVRAQNHSQQSRSLKSRNRQNRSQQNRSQQNRSLRLRRKPTSHPSLTCGRL